MMLTDSMFKRALVISLICHIVFLFNWPPIRNLALLKPSDDIKVTYYPVNQVPVSSDFVADQEKRGRPPVSTKLKEETQLARPKQASKPSFKTKPAQKLSVDIKDLTSDKHLAIIPSEKKMLISHNEKDFSDEPMYLNYYNSVRGKIYDAAYRNRPYFANRGNVRLAFTLSRNGRLISAEIVESGTTRDPVLRRHAIMSVRKASPFAPFLASMHQDQLTLRLTISFEK